ncbi:ABC transporter substrate-binding protein [Zwartia sp.]|uniref:ABC transporter substrate-binding protein n=1 Tax=Zwartia sp. TaxID=2978004 RepID=UPI002715D45C|nr:ABC transporter substrate-binding protein [Zwartia sp.]MDO9025656.1 ABC transporter substrate-binding protein [Zwartia sp.]
MVKLRVGAISRNYFNMPLWVAVHQKMFQAEGLDVSVELFEPIDAVWQRLQDGRLDIALGVTEHIILDKEQGGHLEIIGGNVNRLPFSLIAGKSIRSFEDMRGKTVGVSSIQAGSSSLVMKIFEAHGLYYPKDYNIVAVGPILARWEKLQSGEIDAGLQGTPLNEIAKDLGYPSLCEPRDSFPWFQFTSLNVDSRWAKQHHETVVAFMKAFIRAHQWFYQNKHGACQIAMQETQIAERYAELAWEEYTQAEIFPRDARANPESIQTLIEISGLLRSLPKRKETRANDYINHSYLDEAQQKLAL